ncbi:MAG: SIS domain-containing protein [Pseudomonadota bacterium]
MGSIMAAEIAEIPVAAERLLRAGVGDAPQVVAMAKPHVVLTLARGSSDHAASVVKYAIETMVGVPVASFGPSVVSIYGAATMPVRAVVVVISQSGASVDLLRAAERLQAGGAPVVALTNRTDSPLAAMADAVVDLSAGPERAVAATKSFVNSVLAGLMLVAAWSGNGALSAALERLPGALAGGTGEGLGALEGADKAMVVGRGPGFGIAQEMALKLIELCGIQALAYSGAEMLHGPRRLIGPGYPVITVEGGARGGLSEANAALEAQGARVFRAPSGVAGHFLAEPLLAMPWFYGAVEALSRARGNDPDRPPHLMKETVTV